MRYPLSRVQHLLGAPPSTLRRWLHHAHITPEKDPSDWRRRLLSDEQIAQLARMHKRVIVIQKASDI